MKNKKGGLMYLIKDKGYNNFKQVNCCASYSSDIGTAIHTRLPHWMAEEGTYNEEIIRSDNKRFNKILFEEAGKLEEAIISGQSKLIEVKKNIELISEARDNPEDLKYLIRHAENYHLYLQKDSISRYSNNIGLAIHDIIPSFVLYEEKLKKLWISSEEKEFEEILSEAYFGNESYMGLKAIKDNTEYHLNRYGKNLSIITDALNGNSIQKYIDEDNDKRAWAMEMLRKNYRE